MHQPTNNHWLILQIFDANGDGGECRMLLACTPPILSPRRHRHHLVEQNIRACHSNNALFDLVLNSSARVIHHELSTRGWELYARRIRIPAKLYIQRASSLVNWDWMENWNGSLCRWIVRESSLIHIYSTITRYFIATCASTAKNMICRIAG